MFPYNSYSDYLLNFKFKRAEWEFVDLRIDIPPLSFGSDAMNPHTQYSNPIAFLNCQNFEAIGSSFTLGAGNNMICEAADLMVCQLEGKTINDLINSTTGFYEQISNPPQIRWLSPNSGIPMMAAGLIINTLFDAASKNAGLPAWEYLAKLPTETILNLISLRHVPSKFDKKKIEEILDQGLIGIEDRCNKIKKTGLPVYFTTWYGHDWQTISDQISRVYSEKGIKQFKIKISSQIQEDFQKLVKISEMVPNDVKLCVDANQTLSFPEAERWMKLLSENNFMWLEEPFAPDNLPLFKALINSKNKNNFNCEIVTGENCPNHYLATALMEMGIDRFQSDPCRMLGLLDNIIVCCIAKISDCAITPHAGGSSLDELSPHIQMFNLARVRTDITPNETLTENVGFCSHFFSSSTKVKNGMAFAPLSIGFLKGLENRSKMGLKDYVKGVSWLEL